MKIGFNLTFISAVAFCAAQTPLSADSALKLAVQNRPLIASAKLSIEQAKALSKAGNTPGATTLFLGASSRSEIGANDQDLGISQPIDLFGRRIASRKVGESSVRLSYAEYVAKAAELQNQVLTSFAEAVAKQHQKEVADELLEISEKLLTATRRRFEEGKVAEIQVVRAKIEVERSKQSSEIKAADLKASLQTLASLIGVDASKIALQADAKIFPVQNLGDFTRPDILILKSQVQLAEAEAGVAATFNRPELSLQLVRSPWSNNPGYFAGRVQLTWSLFDHGRARNEQKAAKLRTQSAQKMLDDTMIKAKAEMQAAQITVEARQSQTARYESILASALELVAKSQKGYSEGFGTLIDVLEATRALREIEQELVEARQQLSLAVIAQYRASGFLAEVLR